MKTSNPGKLVFVSYATSDRQEADRFVAQIEEAGITCWTAPRDVPLGSNYAESIVDAIEDAELMVLLLSENANSSPHVANEIERAVNYRKPIVPVRLADVKPSRSIELHISTRQWVDVYGTTENRQAGIKRLIVTLREALRDRLVTDVPPPSTGTAASAHDVQTTQESVSASPAIHKDQRSEDEPTKVTHTPTSPSPEPGSLINIDFGEHKFDSLTRKGERDTYTFDADAGDVIVIHLVDRNASSGRPLYWVPHIELCDETGNVIAEGSSAVHARIGPELLIAGGTFAIIVSHGINQNHGLHSGTGDYVLFLQRVNNPGRAKPLKIGDELLGILNHGGQVHTYTFDSEGRNEAVITMTREEKGGVYPLLELYDMKGRAVDIVHSYSPVGPVGPAIIKCPLSLSGAYTILASSYFGNEQGIYRISLRISNPPSTEVLIGRGMTLPAHVRSEILQRARIEKLPQISEIAPARPLPKAAVETSASIPRETPRKTTALGKLKSLLNCLQAWATLRRRTWVVVVASLVLLISLYAIVKHYRSLREPLRQSPVGVAAITNIPTEIPTVGEGRTSPAAADGSTVSGSRDLSATKSYDAEIVFENGQIMRNAELSCGPRGWSSYVASIECTQDLEVIRTSEYGPRSGRFIGFDKISRLEFLEMDQDEKHVIDQNRTYRNWVRKFRLTFTDGTVWDKVYLLDHCLFKTNHETGSLEKMRPKTINIKLKN